MPTSTPLLEALKAEESAQRDREEIQRNLFHKDALHASKKDESRKEAAAAASGAASEAKQCDDSTAPL